MDAGEEKKKPPEMKRPHHSLMHEWHAAINKHNTVGENFRHWMYNAKDIADEVPRLIMLFGRERRGELPDIHQQCSHSEPEAVEDNHLICCLGVQCRKCPDLLALEQGKLAADELDYVKAWTCIAHILSKPKYSYDSSEGYIKTFDDILYWQNVWESLAAVDEE